MNFLWVILLISISTVLADTTNTDTAPLGIWTKDGCMVPSSAMSRNDKRLKGLVEVNDGTSRITSPPVNTGRGCESLCGCFNGAVHDTDNLNGYPNYGYTSGSKESEKTHASEEHDSESGKQTFVGVSSPVSYPGPYDSSSLYGGSSEYSKDHSASEYDHQSQKENYEGLQHGSPFGVGKLTYLAGGKESEKTHASQAHDSQSEKQNFNGYQNNVAPVANPGLGTFGLIYPTITSSLSGDSEYTKDHSASEYDQEKNKENYAAGSSTYGRLPLLVEGQENLTDDVSPGFGTRPLQPQPGQFFGVVKPVPSGLKEPFGGKWVGQSPAFGGYLDNGMAGSQVAPVAVGITGEPIRIKPIGGIITAPVSAPGPFSYGAGGSQSEKTHASQVQDSESGKESYLGYQTGKYPSGYTGPYGSDSLVAGNSQYSKDHSASEYSNEKQKENYAALQGGGNGYYSGGLGVGQVDYLAGGTESEKTHSSQIKDSESGKESYLGYQTGKYPSGYTGPYGSDSFVSGNSEYSKDHSASEYNNEKNKENYVGLQGSSGAVYPGAGVGQVGSYVAGSKESDKTHASQVQDSESGKESYLGYNNNNYPTGLVAPSLYGGESLVSGTSQYSKDHSASEYENEKNKEYYGGLKHGSAFGVGKLTFVGGNTDSEHTHSSQVQDSESGQSGFVGYQTGKYPTGYVARPYYGSDSLVGGNSEYSKDHSASEYNNEKNKENYVALQGGSGAAYPGLYSGQVGSYVTGGQESEKTHASQVQDSESGQQSYLGYQNNQYPTGYVGRPYVGDSLAAGSSQYSKDHSASEYNNEKNKENYVGLQGSISAPYPRLTLGQDSYVAGGKQSEKTHSSQVQDSESGKQSYLGYQNNQYPTGYNAGPYGSDSLFAGNSQYSKDHSASTYDNEKNKENYVGLQGSSGAVYPGVVVGQGGSYVAGGKESEKTHSSQVKDSESGKESYLGYQTGKYPTGYTGPYGSDSLVAGNSEYSKDHSASDYTNEKNKEQFVGVQESSSNLAPVALLAPSTAYLAGGKESEKTHSSQVQDSESGKQNFVGYQNNYNPSGYTLPRETSRPYGSDSFISGNSEYSKDHSASEYSNEKNKEQFVGLQESSSKLAPVALLAPSIAYVAGGKESEKTHSSQVQDSESGKQSFVGYNNNKTPVGYTYGSPYGSSALVSGSSEFSKDHSASEFDVSKSSEEYASLNADSLQLYGVPYEVLLSQVKEADCVRCSQLAELRKRQQNPLLLRYRNKQ